MADTKCGYNLEAVSSERLAAAGGPDLRIIVIASLRVYGGKLICGTPAACRNKGRGVELRSRTTQRDGICMVSHLDQPVPAEAGSRNKLTISPSLANAASSVGGASRCLSIPSKTNTNFSAPLLVDLDAKHWPRSTTRLLTCSHRPFPYFSHSLC